MCPRPRPPSTIIQDYSQCVVIDTNFPDNIPGTVSNDSPSLSSSSSVENKKSKTSPYSNFTNYSGQPTAIIKYEPTESKKDENPTFKKFNRPILSPSQIPKKVLHSNRQRKWRTYEFFRLLAEVRKNKLLSNAKKFFRSFFKTDYPKLMDFFTPNETDFKKKYHIFMDLIASVRSDHFEQIIKRESKRLGIAKSDLVNRVTVDGWTLLMYAAMFGRVYICRFLLENDANMNIRNSDGQTALMIASLFGHSEIIKIMVEFGVKKGIEDEILLKHVDENGFTALHYAVVYHQANVLKVLLGLGADPNVPDNEGMTPTLHSCEYLLKNKECLIELIKNGGKVCVRNKAGKTGLDLTDDPGLVMELLQKYSEKPKYEMLTQRSC